MSKLSENQKSSPKMEHFFPEFKWTPTLRCTPYSNYWEDWKCIPYSNYWGDTVKLLGEIYPLRVSAPPWESMVKLSKTASHCVLHNTRRMPSLIELQTFFSDAVQIVNDRPLTTLSNQPNYLTPISYSSPIWARAGTEHAHG